MTPAKKATSTIMRRLISFTVVAWLAVAVVVAQEPRRPLPALPRSRAIVPGLERRTPGQRLQSPRSRPQPENATLDVTFVKQQDALEEESKVQDEVQEPHVIIKSEPGQEFVSFVSGDVIQTQPKPKSEVFLITEPIPGQEFVSFAQPIENKKDSVMSARNGEIFYINIDKPVYVSGTEDSTTETIPQAEPIAIAEPIANENNDYQDSATIEPEYYNNDDDTSLNANNSHTEAPVDTSNFAQNDVTLLDASQGSSVNEIFGKFVDESDLEFGSEVNEDEKTLLPAESKFRSKFEIKEINGQLYEYEYRYYYDEENPEYDYDVVGNIPDVGTNTSIAANTTDPSATTTTTSTTTTTAEPITRTRSRNRGNTAFQTPVVQDNDIVQPNSRSRARSPHLTQPSVTAANAVPTRTTSRDRGRNELEHTINGIDVGEAKLPNHTRFPPRVTTGATPQSRSFGVPLIESIPEHPAPILESNIQADTTDSNLIDESVTTHSPATHSLINLYALSQAAEAEDMETSTVQSGTGEAGTIGPLDFLEANYYDYDYGTEKSLNLSLGQTESATTADYSDLTTTSTSSTTTTATTTTTTTPEPVTTTVKENNERSRTRGNFRDSFAASRGRFSSRGSVPSPDKQPSVATTEASIATTAKSTLSSKRGSNRFSSGALASSGNRFRSFSRTSHRDNEPIFESNNDKTETKENVKSTTDTTTITAESEPNSRKNRFNRPRPNFRSRTNAVLLTTEKPAGASNAKTENSPVRSRLFSRLQRKGRPGAATPEETTDPSIDEVVDETDAVIKHELASEQSTSTTTPPSTTEASRRRGNFGRGRLNRGPQKNTRLQVTHEKTQKQAGDISEIAAKEIVEVALQAELPSKVEEAATTEAAIERGGNGRRGSSRLSARFNSRGRGRGKAEESTITTAAPHVEEEISPAEATTNNTHVANDETIAEEPTPEEETETETNGKRGSSKRTGGVFGRFRNRGTRGGASSQAETTEKPTTTAAPASRRSSFAMLGNKRRRPNRRGEAVKDGPEETAAEAAHEEETAPLDEAVDNELAAQGPQVELEGQASEGQVAVVEQEGGPSVLAAPDDHGAAEDGEEEPVEIKEKKTKKAPRLSLLSRLRNRNRQDRG